MEPQVGIRNIVGTGSLNRDLNVQAVAEDLPVETWENDGPHPGLHARIDGSGEDGKSPLTTFYRSGKYIVRVPSHYVTSEDEEVDNQLVIEELYNENQRVLDELEELGVIESTEGYDIEISNIVATGNLGRQLNLEVLAEALIYFADGTVEYEPEQFPALIYRDEAYPCTMSVFANGSIVLPGGKEIDGVQEAYEDFCALVEEQVGL
jgi:transcription initiation factor TFIID TATA-box-binding protein